MVIQLQQFSRLPHSISRTRAADHLALLLIIASLAAVVAYPTVVYADMGPKPLMRFKIVYDISYVPIIERNGSDVLISSCRDNTCDEGERIDCYSRGYSACTAYIWHNQAPYYKLIIFFADKTRESNLFQGRWPNQGYFKVRVLESSLLVENNEVEVLAYALVLTILTEGAITLVYLLRSHRNLRILVSVVIANIISLPIGWYVFPPGGIFYNPIRLNGLFELFAILFECGCIYLLSRGALLLKQAFRLSIAMNIISAVIGIFAVP